MDGCVFFGITEHQKHRREIDPGGSLLLQKLRDKALRQQQKLQRSQGEKAQGGLAEITFEAFQKLRRRDALLLGKHLVNGGIHGRVGGTDGHHGDAANKPHQAQHRQIPHQGHCPNHRGFQIENPAHFTLTAFSCASTPSSAALKQWAWVMAFSVRFMQSRIS